MHGFSHSRDTGFHAWIWYQVICGSPSAGSSSQTATSTGWPSLERPRRTAPLAPDERCPPSSASAFTPSGATASPSRLAETTTLFFSSGFTRSFSRHPLQVPHSWGPCCAKNRLLPWRPQRRAYLSAAAGAPELPPARAAAEASAHTTPIHRFVIVPMFLPPAGGCARPGALFSEDRRWGAGSGADQGIAQGWLARAAVGDEDGLARVVPAATAEDDLPLLRDQRGGHLHRVAGHVDQAEGAGGAGVSAGHVRPVR